MTEERMARYFTRVHAANLHADYGVRVEVLASSRQDAVDRAISLGWSGSPRDARVRIDRVVDEGVSS